VNLNCDLNELHELARTLAHLLAVLPFASLLVSDFKQQGVVFKSKIYEKGMYAIKKAMKEADYLKKKLSALIISRQNGVKMINLKH